MVCNEKEISPVPWNMPVQEAIQKGSVKTDNL
jgi:hypothetical protein